MSAEMRKRKHKKDYDGDCVVCFPYACTEETPPAPVIEPPDNWDVIRGAAINPGAAVIKWWVQAVSEILLDLQKQGVELEVPAEPVVPYLDHN